MPMILSIVTGTYNRLASLQRMIESVRSQIPRHIPYEFVVVDGGSTDGTLEWLETLPEVTIIRHGELRGAIVAFCDGAKMARGQYVVMANDDIIFQPYSLMRALSHLTDFPSCGGVAFADNRSAQIGRDFEHRVESMPATSANGNSTDALYAQVGMFRKWLGDAAGWWGADDSIMRLSRTYGGDNYLSARIWEMGFSIDAVPGCLVDDGIANDVLRKMNNATGHQDSAVYYQRYPRGPRLQIRPQSSGDEQLEPLRIMTMPIYEPRFPGRLNMEYGFSEAFASVGLTWEIDYVNEPFDLPDAVGAWKPHLLFTQFHGKPGEVTPALVAEARDRNPGMVVVNWNGDAHERNLISPEAVEILREVDLQLVVNAKVLPVYASMGIPAAYWQIPYKDPAEAVPEMPAHDVLFMGNCYNAERRELVSFLQSLPYNVGIYGSCDGALGNTHYSFAQGRGLYQKCAIAISDTYPGTEAFVSNRLLQALSAGAFVLQQESNRLEEFNGWKDGLHYVVWKDLEDLAFKIAYYLNETQVSVRESIGYVGMEYTRKFFSHDAQIRKLFTLIDAIGAKRSWIPS